MKKATVVRIVVAALIAALLGGAYFIVARNTAGAAEGPIPYGFVH